MRTCPRGACVCVCVCVYVSVSVSASVSASVAVSVSASAYLCLCLRLRICVECVVSERTVTRAVKGICALKLRSCVCVSVWNVLSANAQSREQLRAFVHSS